MERVRDIAIAIAVILVAGMYAWHTSETISYNKRFDSARLNCAHKNNNYQNKDAYASCMLYAGFDNNVNFNYGQNQNTNFNE